MNEQECFEVLEKMRDKVKDTISDINEQRRGMFLEEVKNKIRYFVWNMSTQEAIDIIADIRTELDTTIRVLRLNLSQEKKGVEKEGLND